MLNLPYSDRGMLCPVYIGVLSHFDDNLTYMGIAMHEIC